MCNCPRCKAKRNCKTNKEYIEFLKEEIKEDKNSSEHDKWCADTNMDFTQQEIEAIESGEYKPIEE